MKTTEKTTEKVILGLGVAVGVTILGVFGYQYYKSMKKMNKREKKEKQNLEELGVSPDKVAQEIKYHEKDNFVKKLFVSTTFMAQAIIDDDVLDTDSAFESSNTVHIFQKRRSEIWTGGNFKEVYNRNYLEFMIEIPDYINDKSRLHISDYVKCLKAAANHMRDDIAKFSPFPERELVGWLKITYDNPSYDPEDDFSYKRLDGFVEMPKWVYREYEDGEKKDRGVTKLFAEVAGKDTFGAAEEKVAELLNELYPNLHPSVEYMGLAYRIIFPIQDETYWGLTLMDALQCIKYLCTEFEVVKTPDTGSNYDRTDYPHIIFHAPNSKGKWSWRRFYDVDDENNVVCLDYNDR